MRSVVISLIWSTGCNAILSCMAARCSCIVERYISTSGSKSISLIFFFCRMHSAGKALHELLVSAQRQECLTVGVYESAKVMNVDPDNVTFCILAADEFDEGDIALQIHFTLIQAFCCENDINIVRLNDTEKLAQILGYTDNSGEPKDLHCILITVSIMFLLLSSNVLALCLSSLLASFLVNSVYSWFLFFALPRIQMRMRGKTQLWRNLACSVKKAEMLTTGFPLSPCLSEHLSCAFDCEISALLLWCCAPG
ncbi:hypothetical protein GDO86_001526 [Hymenochirus boettgeri]|uniref:Ribosomal protein eL8/eL30/eS12/Gadd45 domain-containing protein n=1 Tax=Hymenochirus boettgeri TaxID=247094 RepID=A0A8T2KE11_9PIPI|nr:hypothetical protein GDO86_001526 [Hymenochirus boettgeri]